MALTLTFLGRVADRWRVRVALPDGVRPRGLTVGLWDESGQLLGPVVVAPEDAGSCWVAELRGPCQLPPGTLVRATLDTEDGFTVEEDLGVDPRKGLHAFLHADGRLPVQSAPTGAALSGRETAALARYFPWICACPTGAPAEDDDLAELLSAFGVDAADLSEELRATLRK